MSEDIERGLRGALRRATDGLTDNPDRYDEVARRVRRRRTGAIAGITSAVVLLAAIGGFALANQGGDSGKNGNTVVANEPKVDELDLTCEAPSGGPVRPKATSGKPFVRDGAVAARLCPALPDDPQSNVKPDQALLNLRLHSGAAQLVATLNKLPAFDPAAFCTMDMGPSYDLLLVYGDGKKVTVTFNAYGCGVAKSGAEFRMDAGKLHEQFADLAKKEKPATPSALSCPAPSGGVGEAKQTGGGALVPEGATVARLCPALKMGALLYTELDPADLAPILRTGVDQLVTKVNHLRGVSFDAACTSDLGPTFDLLLAYPDGSTKVVTFEMFGCGNVRSGSEFRQGGHEIGTLFRSLAKQQNPAPPGTETCPEPSGGVGTPKNTGTGEFVRPGATTAQLCEGLADQKLGDPALIGKVATTGVDLIVSKLNAMGAATPDGPCRADAGPTYDLHLGYPDGTRVLVTFEPFGCGHAKSGSEFRSGARDLDDLFTQLVGDPGAPHACPPPSGGPKLVANAGPAGELVEQGATEAQLCPGRASDPVDPIHSYPLRTGLDSLVSKLNALAIPGKEMVCTDEMGLLYDLVLTYPDGHTRLVKLQNYGCGDVESDGRRRVGARSINEAFRELAEQQRLASPPSYASGPDCGKPLWALQEQAWPQFLPYESFLLFTDKFVPQPAVEALACRYSASDDPGFAGEAKGVPISRARAETLRSLVNEAMDLSVSCEIAPSDPVDVLSFGDQGRGNSIIAIGRGDCAIVQGKFAAGTASPALLAQLDSLLE